MADEGLNRIGAMLEELGARYELVVEAVSGFGGKVDKLKEEIFGQFAEVGSQIHFISDQIGENRNGRELRCARISALRWSASASMSAGRGWNFASRLATSEAKLAWRDFPRSRGAAGPRIVTTSEELGRDVAESLKKLQLAEIKQTNKAVATLSSRVRALRRSR